MMQIVILFVCLEITEEDEAVETGAVGEDKAKAASQNEEEESLQQPDDTNTNAMDKEFSELHTINMSLNNIFLLNNKIPPCPSLCCIVINKGPFRKHFWGMDAHEGEDTQSSSFVRGGTQILPIF